MRPPARRPAAGHAPQAVLGDGVAHEAQAGQHAKLAKHRGDFVLAPLQRQPPVAWGAWGAAGGGRQAGERAVQGDARRGETGRWRQPAAAQGRTVVPRRRTPDPPPSPDKHVGVPGDGRGGRTQQGGDSTRARRGRRQGVVGRAGGRGGAARAPHGAVRVARPASPEHGAEIPGGRRSADLGASLQRWSAQHGCRGRGQPSAVNVFSGSNWVHPRGSGALNRSTGSVGCGVSGRQGGRGPMWVVAWSWSRAAMRAEF